MESIYDDLDLTINTITVACGISGSLSLARWVRNLIQSGSFAKINSVVPCERVSFKTQSAE